MNVLDVHQVGPMATVQDLGRKGLHHAGVSGCGPMDTPSFRIANALVGNHGNAAALEFAGVGGMFSVSQPALFSVTGGDVSIHLDGTALHPWESYRIEPGQQLHIGALRDCVWGYLAFAGGIDLPSVLGSLSTHLRSGVGGLDGRRLQAGDRLSLHEAHSKNEMALSGMWRRSVRPIRVVPGPQDDYFSAETRKAFTQADFIVSAARDRMAQMLDGQKIRAERGHDIVSDGTSAGSIQVPSSGRPIVLMAERQTTGGYPKIGTVASVDLPRLAQVTTGRSVRFNYVSQDEAEALLISERAALRNVLGNLVTKPNRQNVRGDMP